jgi:hypothetical protein
VCSLPSRATPGPANSPASCTGNTRLRSRATTHDVYSGELEGDCQLLAITNWVNSTQNVTIDLASVLGVQSAFARDAWARQFAGLLHGKYTTTLAGHDTQVLVLSAIRKTSVVTT